ncbi:MAG: chemotaxis protein CheW [Desulfobacterales bacterium]|nr:chemotaxis protein CheW [Desulfobacterales bacterium]
MEQRRHRQRRPASRRLLTQKRIGEVLVETGVVSTAEVGVGPGRAGAGQRHAGRSAPAPKRPPASAFRPHKLDCPGEPGGRAGHGPGTADPVLGQRRTTRTSSASPRRWSGSAPSSATSPWASGCCPSGRPSAKFKRLVRDLSAELGKDIGFIMEGEETELDKTVIDKLSDPLVHLIRNSIDHGIEAPEMQDRLGQARPRHHPALGRALRGPCAHLASPTTAPGSTRMPSRPRPSKKASSPPTLPSPNRSSTISSSRRASPRPQTSPASRDGGVGMDVVRSSIEALGGIVEVRQRHGPGHHHHAASSRSTLAIIDGLLVNIADELLRHPPERSGGVRRADPRRTERTPTAATSSRCATRSSPTSACARPSTSTGSARPSSRWSSPSSAGRRVGFVVDKVIGEHQTVIKNLGHLFKATNGVSGATILGDGSVALILDIHKLIQQAEVDDAA